MVRTLTSSMRRETHTVSNDVSIPLDTCRNFRVYDQWLIDSLNLEQISVQSALSNAIASLPLAFFSVLSVPPNAPLALTVSSLKKSRIKGINFLAGDS